MPKRVERNYAIGRVDATQADGFFTDSTQQPRRSKNRVVSVRLSQVMPDRYQPRPILPIELKNQFYAYFDENLAATLPKGKEPLSIYEAASEWLKLSKSNKAVEDRVKRLLSLGDTVEEVGQIKPATGKWSQNSKGAIFALESGERRMWSLALTFINEGNDPSAGNVEEPKIEVLEVQKTSRERQVVENRHAETPTAVARAREVASLVLEKQDIHPDPNSVDDYAYFRQVTEIKRLPKGFWTSIEKIMGISDYQMRRLLRILQLPTPMLEKADMYNLPERVLREVIQASPNSWETLINAAVLKNLTAEDIEASIQTKDEKKEVPKKAPRKVTVSEKAARKSVGMISSLKNLNKSEMKKVVTEISFKMKYNDERLFEAADSLEELAKHLRTEAQHIRQDKAYE